MPNQIPDEIELSEGQSFLVFEEELYDKKLGCLDTGQGVILIEKNQPEVGKHLILLHEIIHLVAEILKEKGVLENKPDENFVKHCAGVLFPILAFSGIWNGVTRDECKKFIFEQIDREGNPRE